MLRKLVFSRKKRFHIFEENTKIIDHHFRTFLIHVVDLELESIHNEHIFLSAKAYASNNLFVFKSTILYFLPRF